MFCKEAYGNGVCDSYCDNEACVYDSLECSSGERKLVSFFSAFFYGARHSVSMDIFTAHQHNTRSDVTAKSISCSWTCV